MVIVLTFCAAGCEKMEVKRDYYPNGKLMVEKFVRGSKETNKVYHINGQLIGEHQFKNGVRHGTSKIYNNTTGELFKTVKYRNGEEISSRVYTQHQTKLSGQ